MFGPPGIAYVYLVYGHACLNVVSGPDGFPAAILLRSVVPVEGVEAMRVARVMRAVSYRRADRDNPEAAAARLARVPDALLAVGPANLAAAFGVERSDNGVDLLDPASPAAAGAGAPMARPRWRSWPRRGSGSSTPGPDGQTGHGGSWTPGPCGARGQPRTRWCSPHHPMLASSSNGSGASRAEPWANARGSGLYAKAAAQHSREKQPAPMLIGEVDDRADDLARPDDSDARSDVSWHVTLNHVARLETGDIGRGDANEVSSLSASVRPVIEVQAHATRRVRRGRRLRDGSQRGRRGGRSGRQGRSGRRGRHRRRGGLRLIADSAACAARQEEAGRQDGSA